MNLESLTSIRELDSRVGDGLHVRLWWNESNGEVWVSVLDTRSGEALSIAVAQGQRPLDVFHHPFAYAPRERVEAINAYAA
ncbi:MAG TPA: hypothetical protein VHU61_07380 [Solirubrobacteraceae bacterium]|jgi:hypothetical protein|nr:hypothetical protein [Solirubrobacteraceae bacterium]